MTLKEFYAVIGGNYDATLRRIPRESMVQRFAKKYAADPTYGELQDAVAKQDWEAAFRAAHTLKGVSQNLGFDQMYHAVFELTEALRGGKALKDPNLYQAVVQEQELILDALAHLE